MSNHHLKDTQLSLKAVGLLSKMLSLSDDWNYTTRGLAAICREGVDAISAGLKELEKAGYLERRRVRDDLGHIIDTEYVIYETPKAPQPDTAQPYTENPDMGMPHTENPAQSSTNKSITQKSNTHLSSTHSIHSPAGNERKERCCSQEEYDDYRETIRENIEYNALLYSHPADADRIDELIELIVETVCSGRAYIRIAGQDMPLSVVRSRFLKLNSEHIDFVLTCMDENTTRVINMKQYLLTSLYNAPATMGNYFTSRVNHDCAK